MKTLRSNTKLIERYIQGTLKPSDKLLFEAKLILSPTLFEQYLSQKKAFEMVKFYHRKKLKEELETLHKTIFNNPQKTMFKLKIHKIFNI